MNGASRLCSKLVGTELTSSQEYLRCLSVLLLEASPDLIPERWLSQSRVTDFSAAVGKQALQLRRLSDPEEKCTDPELLNHDTVWAHATRWRNACWLTVLTADGSINNQNCGYHWDLKIWYSKSSQVAHKNSCHCGVLPRCSLFTYFNLNLHNTTLSQDYSSHLKMLIQSSEQPCMVSTVFNSILQLRKLRHRMVR